MAEFVSICFVLTDILRPTALNASAWTRLKPTVATPTAQRLVKRRISKGMATATTKTSEGLGCVV